MLPLPEPAVRLTMYVVPEPLTPVMDAPVRPAPVTRLKSLVSTPVTASEKITMKLTLVAFVGLAVADVDRPAVGVQTAAAALGRVAADGAVVQVERAGRTDEDPAAVAA